MSSPQSEGAEMSSGSVVVSVAGSAAKSHRPEARKTVKETHRSPFKVPDNEDIFQMGIDAKEERQEEMRKFQALSIAKKTSHAAKVKARVKKELWQQEEEEEEGEEEEEKIKHQKQIKSKAVLPKQTPCRHRQELKIAMMKQENIPKDRKHDLISMQREMAVSELYLMTKKSEILKMDKALEKEKKSLNQLEMTIERENVRFEELLRENEKKSMEAMKIFEQETKSKQETNAEIRKLTTELGSIKRELAKFEGTLIHYNACKELLFKLSPPEWQEAQKKKKALEAKVLPDGEAQQNTQTAESAISHGLESELPSIREAGESSAHSSTLIANPKLDKDDSEYEDKPELYFTDPQQLLDVMTELKDQNLSLISKSTRVENTLELLRQSMQEAQNVVKKDEEELREQINFMNQKLSKEKARGAKLKLKVQLHDALVTEDQDALMDTLGEKVTEVYRYCVDNRMTKLSTLEKLAGIENRMSVLLLELENVPEEKLEMMKKIKDSERRSREREEKLREQREKQKERMRRYLERSFADSKKKTGRKLMPRCLPIVPKVKVSNVDNSRDEDEINANLFSDDMD